MSVTANDSLFTAVLVLYRMQLEDCRCYRSLVESMRTSGHMAGMLLYVYDNSPEPLSPSTLPVTKEGFVDIVYWHDPHNGGLAAAYNAALLEARRNGSRWLLLLDQDTEITSEYLLELFAASESVPDAVSAIIPRLHQHGAIHSPQHLPKLSHRPVEGSTIGLLQFEVTAFNSGAALRVAALTQFPRRYWLDFLDHAVFHKLQAAGGQVWLMQARLAHQLSTEQLGIEATLARYLNVLQAERDFYDEHGSVSDRTFYHLRRVKQAVGQSLKVKDKRFALLSLHAALGLLPPTPVR